MVKNLKEVNFYPSTKFSNIGMYMCDSILFHYMTRPMLPVVVLPCDHKCFHLDIIEIYMVVVEQHTVNQYLHNR